MRRTTIAVATASSVAGVLAGLIVGSTTAGADAQAPGSFNCRLASNATIYLLEHPDLAGRDLSEVRALATQATQDCNAGK